MNPLFPAQAGVIPLHVSAFSVLLAFPRASGGDPDIPFIDLDSDGFSPRKRG